MATAQRSKSTSESKPKSQQAPPQAGRGTQSRTSRSTPEEDTNYNLISVLYHALQAAETYGQYIEDAEDQDDDELIRLFEQVRTAQNGIAEQARRLLTTRLAGGGRASGAQSGRMQRDEEEGEDEDIGDPDE